MEVRAMDAAAAEHRADDVLKLWFPADGFRAGQETFGKWMQH
jgi:hypothetical protein